MKIGQHWTVDERVEVEVLCQQTHEALLRMSFMLGVDRPLQTLSLKESLYFVGLRIERMLKSISEMEAMLRNDGWLRAKKGAHHDRS